MVAFELVFLSVFVGATGVAIAVGLFLVGKALSSPKRPENLLVDGLADSIVKGGRDPGRLLEMYEQLLSKRNELLTFLGQFVLSSFVVAVVAILLLTQIITAEAGLPILAGIAGFAIGKGSSTARSLIISKREE